MAWQIQDAKNRFSELIDRARDQGPQLVTRHGRPVVQVVAVTAQADSQAPATGSFAKFLLSMPKAGTPDGLPVAPRRNRRQPLKPGD